MRTSLLAAARRSRSVVGGWASTRLSSKVASSARSWSGVQLRHVGLGGIPDVVEPAVDAAAHVQHHQVDRGFLAALQLDQPLPRHPVAAHRDLQVVQSERQAGRRVGPIRGSMRRRTVRRRTRASSRTPVSGIAAARPSSCAVAGGIDSAIPSASPHRAAPHAAPWPMPPPLRPFSTAGALMSRVRVGKKNGDSPLFLKKGTVPVFGSGFFLYNLPALTSPPPSGSGGSEPTTRSAQGARP